MKLIAKTFAVLLLLYGLLWVGVLVYFNYAGQHKGLLETNLSSVFGRQVSIQAVHTAWSGVSPLIRINGFQVAGDNPQQPALAFESLSAKFSITSLFRFWPKLTALAVKQPQLEIVSLANNRLQIAGIELRPNSDVGINPKRLISWLLNHQSAVWHDGEIVWQHRNGDLQRYSNVSFIYDRRDAARSINAAMVTDNGPFAFMAESRGDILAAKDWDGSFEVLGNQGQQLLASEDVSITVQKGLGRFELKSLNILRIREFLLLTGLGEAAKWVLDAQLSGVLSDVEFTFSGPFLAFESWSLKALASKVGFIATPANPGMSGLAGKVDASMQGGVFEFSADSAKFSWPRLFAEGIAVTRAAGQFRWVQEADGKLEIKLEKGEFEDDIAKIWGLNASCSIDSKSRNIMNLGQLFKVESVSDLSYENGGVVTQSTASGNRAAPLRLHAEAKFALKTFAAASVYLPRDPRIDKFRSWWQNAFLQGSVSNGRVTYQGEVSANALATGKAKLLAQADFKDVSIDYGYQRDWPKLLNASGTATLDNDLLTISPDLAWIEEDQIFDSSVTIQSLFTRNRTLQLQASTVTTLPKVMDFLFDGPLLKPELRGQPLPIKSSGGKVSADVRVTIPLAKITDTEVVGHGKLTKGEVLLPQNVPISDVSADIHFTERSVTADDISATFLNGSAQAKLVTTEEAQPPKMRITAVGEGEIKQLQPWIGEHMLSWFDGRTAWQGAVAIDGPKVTIEVDSDLKGVKVNAPAPLTKSRNQPRPFSLSMQLGNSSVQQQLAFEYGDYLRARFSGKVGAKNSFLDNSLIRMGDQVTIESLALKPGINYLIDYDALDLDAWLAAVIDLAQLPTAPVEEPNTAFLDAMRSVKIAALDPQLLGRSFGAIELSALSVDGANWIAEVDGANIKGSVTAAPREKIGQYNFNLDKLHIGKASKQQQKPAPIDKNLRPAEYPSITLNAKSFQLSGKSLGQLSVVGEPLGKIWMLKAFEIIDQGIRTTGKGQWTNNKVSGSLSRFELNTVIDEAGEVLDEMEFSGLLKKGDGKLEATIEWIGAPHEFDFTRLNGEYDFHIDDGELVKVEPGSGKLIGLLNSNAIFKRLTLDFRDVFSNGLQFDRMRFAGLLANGEAIMRDAYMLTPSVFVQMEGKLNLGKELIDMEFHVSPELGGNLALLSALANPAAGAVVFLTQKIFKDEMRATSFIDYRALGTWEDFEIEEFDSETPEPSTVSPATEQTVEIETPETQVIDKRPIKPLPRDAKIVTPVPIEPVSKLTTLP